MRIWLLTSELPSGIAAGIARYIDNFARLLGRRGHEVVIVACGAGAIDREFAPGVQLVTFTDATEGHALTGKTPHRRYPYDVIVYGHTHRPLIDRARGQLVVNPGAAGPRRFDIEPTVARLSIVAGRAAVEILPLEGGDE